MYMYTVYNTCSYSVDAEATCTRRSLLMKPNIHVLYMYSTCRFRARDSVLTEFWKSGYKEVRNKLIITS